jgi:hypothetical protein
VNRYIALEEFPLPNKRDEYHETQQGNQQFQVYLPNQGNLVGSPQTNRRHHYLPDYWNDQNPKNINPKRPKISKGCNKRLWKPLDLKGGNDPGKTNSDRHILKVKTLAPILSIIEPKCPTPENIIQITKPHGILKKI